MNVRTRFAPSPTGALHAGTVRTALFAWLVARQSGGQFILRIEDTDQKREVEGSIDNIIETLTWLGLNWEEGPDKTGNCGPYTQSQRLPIYIEWVERLLVQGLAYIDPYTAEEVEGFRKLAQKEKRPFLYRNHRPKSADDTEQKWDGTRPIRLKSDPKIYTWVDAVMGELSMGEEMIDDFVLIKSDGFPTYNFCHIVDDHLMGITHVVRSQEFLSSTPKFLNLYEALKLDPPIFITVPPVLRSDGHKKLSKRDGAKELLDYKKEGYLPEALASFMATLGWNDGTEQEIFTTEELVSKFQVSKIQKSGAIFDEQRLLWINGYMVRQLSIDSLYDLSTSFWPDEANAYDDVYKKRVLATVQERLKYFAELPDLTRFYFMEPPVDNTLITSHKQLKKLTNVELQNLLKIVKTELERSDFSIEDLTTRLNTLLEKTNQKPAVLFSLVRIAITRIPASPGLADTLSVLGKSTSIRRITEQTQAL